MATCAICGREIPDPKGAWKQMSGWVSPHGAKAMTATKATGDIAHAECIVALRLNVNVNQETLV